jgi:hypothetical protein
VEMSMIAAISYPVLLCASNYISNCFIPLLDRGSDHLCPLPPLFIVTNKSQVYIPSPLARVRFPLSIVRSVIPVFGTPMYANLGYR